MKKNVYVYVLCFLLSITASNAQELTINNAHFNTDLTTEWYLFKDSTLNYNIAEIVKQDSILPFFQPKTPYKIINDPIYYHYWLRISINNKSDQTKYYITFLKYLDVVEIYWLESDKRWKSTTTGLQTWAGSSEIRKEVNLTALINLREGKNTIYIKITGNSWLHQQRGTLSAHINSIEGVWYTQLQGAYLMGILGGVVILILLYNIITQWVIRKKYYTTFIVSSLLNLLALVHFIKPDFIWFWAEMPFWAFYLPYLLYPLSTISQIWFLQIFLSSYFYAPIFHQIFNFLKFFSLLLLILFIFGELYLMVGLIHLFYVSYLFLSLFITYQRRKQGFQPAQHIFFANLVALLFWFFNTYQNNTISLVPNFNYFYSLIAEILSLTIYFRALMAQNTITEKDLEKKEREKALIEQESKLKLDFEKDRIAQDLHDNVGSQLTILIRQLENRNNSEHPYFLEHEKERLMTMAQNAISDLRDTIWGIKKEITFEDLSEKIQEIVWNYNEIAPNIHIKYVIKNQSSRKFNFDTQDAVHIFRITQEALNNAIKYSQASYIEVGLLINNNARLLLRVLDDGVGFDKLSSKRQSRHYGLMNMQSRANKINARLLIETQEGKGTKISLFKEY
ncbi:MAG: hypothetical protein EAZ55_04930 [Cytophagales bacterium]|nr:MAG: hypothetical protein EAZ55_04930 [Cytophagales bacterium]